MLANDKVSENWKAEKLDKVYVCSQCDKVFLFQEDVAHHAENLGHCDIAIFPFDRPSRQSSAKWDGYLKSPLRQMVGMAAPEGWRGPVAGCLSPV